MLTHDDDNGGGCVGVVNGRLDSGQMTAWDHMEFCLSIVAKTLWSALSR